MAPKGRKKKANANNFNLKAKENERNAKMVQLIREIKLGTFNAKRSGKRWNDMITHIKLLMIKENLEAVQNIFERQLNIKNASITFLLNALDKAEDQHRMNVTSHMQQIEHLINIYINTMKDNKIRYQNELEEVLFTENENIEKINENNNENETFLKTVIFSMEQRLNYILNKTESEKIVQYKEKNENEKNIIEAAATVIMFKTEIIRNQLQSIQKAYSSSLIVKDYEEIKTKHDEDQKIIKDLMNRIIILNKVKKKLHEEVTSLQETLTKAVSDTKYEKLYYFNVFKYSEKKFSEEQKVDRNLLKLHLTEYDKVIKYLTNVSKKGERILTLNNICKKYETEEEQLFFYVNKFDVDRECNKTCLGVHHELDLFWKMTESANITKMQLIAEKENLLKENQSLKDKIRYKFCPLPNEMLTFEIHV